MAAGAAYIIMLEQRLEQSIESSPYLEEEHLLDLKTLDRQSRFFAIALKRLKPHREDYATVEYESSLNLDEVLSKLRRIVALYGHKWKQQDFYVVEFRSQLKPKIDNALLFKLDEESHREANTSGGLLKYWYGEPDSERRNLATCKSYYLVTKPKTDPTGFWISKEAAIAGGTGPLHKQARAIIPEMYESIKITGLRIRILDRVKGWTLTPSDEGEPTEATPVHPVVYRRLDDAVSHSPSDSTSQL